MSTLLATHELEILDRAIGQAQAAWSVDAAKALLAIKFPPADVARMNELSAKAQQGNLSPDEELEVESYRSAGRLLEILKLRARATLDGARAAPSNRQ